MRRVVPFFAAVLLIATACGGGESSGDDVGSSATRPESPATISILAPKNGEVVRGTSVELRMSLEGGKVVEPSVTKITPTTGHIHVILDEEVVSMDYGLSQTLDELKPGTHTLKIEFVAADHLPFDPRVFDEIAFTVKA
jgi:uncharacterized protein DUF4399